MVSSHILPLKVKKGLSKHYFFFKFPILLRFFSLDREPVFSSSPLLGFIRQGHVFKVKNVFSS